jgi:hypothetical protein
MIAASPGLQEQAFRGFSDLRRRETELVDHRKIVAAFGKTVFQPQVVEGNRLLFQKDLYNGYFYFGDGSRSVSI